MQNLENGPEEVLRLQENSILDLTDQVLGPALRGRAFFIPPY
jgi:hypothetical protein